ncbi:hypothetical protein ABZZ74_47985 [Streptomyces sp. NPDC006476]|uniref:WXG100 family type VII secretion target n=1 Tax=Streptomyces sp. NPDC006476 TaxID=3157175 RepID=UPI00339DBFD1
MSGGDRVDQGLELKGWVCVRPGDVSVVRRQVRLGQSAMSIEIPPALAWVAMLAVGQQWPQGDEDELLALGTAWEETAQELGGLSSQLDPSVSGVLESVAGRVAEAFRDHAEQVLASLAQMAGSAHQLAELATTTGVEIEYAKYMILVQLVWMASEIAQWVLFAPEVVSTIVAAGCVAVQMILRRLRMSIVAGVGLMVGMDAAIQTLQILKGDRTRWNAYNTLQAVESGAVGGAIGGLTCGIPGVLKPRFAESLFGSWALGRSPAWSPPRRWTASSAVSRVPPRRSPPVRWARSVVEDVASDGCAAAPWRSTPSRRGCSKCHVR